MTKYFVYLLVLMSYSCASKKGNQKEHISADMPIEPTMFHFWDLANGYCLLKISTSKTL